MEEKQQRELLEIYKLHAELADRVSHRREGANRLFAGLLTGFSALFAFFLRGESEPFPTFIIPFSALGMAICSSWFFVIRSYRQLNSEKFAALHELEKKLPYRFFTREWEMLKQGKFFRRYWKLTIAETILPIAFAVFFMFVICISI